MTPSALAVHRFDRTRLADGLAVAVAVSLPWSITATDIFIVLWLIAFLPTIDAPALRRTFVLPTVVLTLAFCMLAALGVLWSNAEWIDRFNDFKVFFRLLAIAALLIQFRRSDNGAWVLVGFVMSCAVLLALSWAQFFYPVLDFRRWDPGVPVKDQIIQGGEFLICAFALAHLSLNAWTQARQWSALLLGLLALLFLADIAFVAAARSVLLIFAVLVLMFGVQRFGWKGTMAVAAVAVVLSTVAWVSSPHLRARVFAVGNDMHAYRTERAENSPAYRLEFWRKSLEIISRAPLFGHGTGSLYEQFRLVAKGESGLDSIVTNNPHNQTLTVAIQLGLAGVILLYAMWMAHFRLFGGRALFDWIGQAIVVHSVVAGLFNSQLFEATLGWLYILGVGILGGMTMRARDRRRTQEAARLN